MVPGETFSWRATALFDKPWATRRVILRSWSVSTASTFSLTDSFSSLPAGGRDATSLRDCIKVSGLSRIEIALQAPAAIAAARSPRATEAVKKTNRAGRFSAWTTASISDAVTSENPSSTSTTSGVRLRTASRQLAPSRQDATTLKSVCAANRDAKPCRTIGRRSAITSRMRRMSAPLAGISLYPAKQPRHRYPCNGVHF